MDSSHFPEVVLKLFPLQKSSFICSVTDNSANLNLVPMTRPHSAVLQIINQRHRSLKLIHTVSARFHHFPIFILKKT